MLFSILNATLCHSNKALFVQVVSLTVTIVKSLFCCFVVGKVSGWVAGLSVGESAGWSVGWLVSQLVCSIDHGSSMVPS